MSRKQASYIAGIASVAGLAVLLVAAMRAHATSEARPQHARTSLLAFMAAPLQQEASGEESGKQGSAEGKSGDEKEESPLTEAFHWINFLIVAGGIAYLIKKLFVPFLAERSRLIRDDMEISKKTMAEADQRLGAIENKLKHLDEELAALLQAASQEAQAERQRIEQAASADAAKILAAAEQEIDASGKAARQQLKQYASELALQVAEAKIRSSLTPQSEQQILQHFVKDLAGSNGLASNAKPGNK
jgi:F-type H+-transporting ATPase subunit b